METLPDISRLQTELQTPSQQAVELLWRADRTIATAAEYGTSAELLKSIKRTGAYLEAREKTITGPINTSLKAIRDLFRGPRDILVKAENRLKFRMGDYDEAQRRLAAERQRKLNEAAQRERERLEKLRQAAEQRGDEKKVEQFAERAQQTVAPVVAVEQPKVAGISRRTVWHGEVLDIKKFCTAIGAGTLPSHLVKIAEGELDRYATACKESSLPEALRVWSTQEIAASHK